MIGNGPQQELAVKKSVMDASFHAAVAAAKKHHWNIGPCGGEKVEHVR